MGGGREGKTWGDGMEGGSQGKFTDWSFQKITKKK